MIARRPLRTVRPICTSSSAHSRSSASARCASSADVGHATSRAGRLRRDLADHAHGTYSSCARRRRAVAIGEQQARGELAEFAAACRWRAAATGRAVPRRPNQRSGLPRRACRPAASAPADDRLCRLQRHDALDVRIGLRRPSAARASRRAMRDRRLPTLPRDRAGRRPSAPHRSLRRIAALGRKRHDAVHRGRQSGSCSISVPASAAIAGSASIREVMRIVVIVAPERRLDALPGLVEARRIESRRERAAPASGCRGGRRRRAGRRRR